MDWIRGEKLGNGSFATVNLAVTKKQSHQFPPLMAVKSCGITHSASLLNEKLILQELKDCPEIIQCYGETFSSENGEKLYNVLLEYASGGALSEKLKTSQKLPELEVRRYTKALLKGLNYIHKFGYVHCDIKLQNILLGDNGGLKIADFGLAKKQGSNLKGELRGTPLYMSPEMVTGGEVGSPADIWAVGCVAAEMFAGAPAWRCGDVAGLLMRIGAGDEVPEVPCELSDEGKDFLGRCFVRDPSKRWTAEMLLRHPFVCGDHVFDDVSCDYVESHEKKNITSSSPGCVFDFPDWDTCSIASSPEDSSDLENPRWSTAAAERLRGVVCDQKPSWSISEIGSTSGDGPQKKNWSIFFVLEE